jgi:hypothetical protein
MQHGSPSCFPLPLAERAIVSILRRSFCGAGLRSCAVRNEAGICVRNSGKLTFKPFSH